MYEVDESFTDTLSISYKFDSLKEWEDFRRADFSMKLCHTVYYKVNEQTIKPTVISTTLITVVDVDQIVESSFLGLVISAKNKTKHTVSYDRVPWEGYTGKLPIYI